MHKHIIWAPWILIGPVLALFVILYAIPLTILFASSVDRIDTSTFAVIDTFTTFNFRHFFFDSYYVGVLLLTLKISVLVTLTCIVLGYPVAAYLAIAGQKERRVLILLVVSPLLVSIVIRNFGWLIVLGPKGFINVTLMAAGILDSPLRLLYTQPAVVIGLAHVFYPFMVLSIFSAVRNIDPAIIRAARNLGAHAGTLFWRISLPLSAPGILAGSLIVFGLSMSAFVTPAILGGPWVKVVAYLAWEQNVVILDWPFAAAISVILLLVTGAVMIAYNRLVERTWFAGAFQ